MSSDLIKQYTKFTIENLAPDEEFLIDSYNPDIAFAGKTAGGPQGFGAGEVIVLMTPFIYAFFTKYTEAVASEAGKKTFAAVVEWLTQQSLENEKAAQAEIRKALIDAGMPADGVDRAAEAVASTIKKFA